MGEEARRLGGLLPENAAILEAIPDMGRSGKMEELKRRGTMC